MMHQLNSVGYLQLGLLTPVLGGFMNYSPKGIEKQPATKPIQNNINECHCESCWQKFK